MPLELLQAGECDHKSYCYFNPDCPVYPFKHPGYPKGLRGGILHKTTETKLKTCDLASFWY